MNIERVGHGSVVGVLLPTLESLLAALFNENAPIANLKKKSIYTIIIKIDYYIFSRRVTP